MPTIEDTYFTELIATITGSLPEIVNGVATIAGSIHRSTSINRTNWENLVNGGKLVAPYVIIELGTEVQEDWAMDADTFRVPTTIYYIADSNDPGAAVSGGGFAIEAYVRDRLRTLSRGLKFYTGTGFQLAGKQPIMDTSEANPANLVFYQIQAKKFGGMLMFAPLIGEAG